MALADSFVKTEFKPEDELEEQRKADLLEEMGITQYDVDKLRAMMLSPEEAVCAKKEELEKIQQHKGQKDDWDEFVDVKRRMGRVLPHPEIIQRLRSMIPRLLICRGGERGKIGLYVLRNTPTAEIPGYPLTANGLSHTDVPVYVGWIDEGESPEYEIDIVNDVNVAIGQKRGWRTLLLRLHMRRLAHCKLCLHDPKVHAGLKGPKTSIITEEQMLKAFGPPTNGATASNYRKQLWEFRNGLK